VFFFERKGIDDPVGAISVHGVGGIFGVLCIGLFGNGAYGAGWNGTEKGIAATSGQGVTGIFYDFEIGIRQLGAQAVGALVICTVMLGIAYLFFKFQDSVMKGGIRSTAEDEIAGLDLPEMGVLAYDNLQLNELDIVGADGTELEFSGGPSPDPTIGR
jgi:Amt family ammonium transporter